MWYVVKFYNQIIMTDYPSFFINRYSRVITEDSFFPTDVTLLEVVE